MAGKYKEQMMSETKYMLVEIESLRNLKAELARKQKSIEAIWVCLDDDYKSNYLTSSYRDALNLIKAEIKELK